MYRQGRRKIRLALLCGVYLRRGQMATTNTSFREGRILSIHIVMFYLLFSYREVRNILPEMTPHPHTSYKSSAISRRPHPTKVRGQSTIHPSKGAVQKRKLGKLFGSPLQEAHVTTDHANFPANTWKDILIGLQTGKQGGSIESITLHRDADHPKPAPPEGHVLKNGTSNGFVGFTRKPGRRVSLVPLPKNLPSSQ